MFYSAFHLKSKGKSQWAEQADTGTPPGAASSCILV